MNKFLVFFSIVVVYIFFIYSCSLERKDGEKLAKRYCSSCHLYTEPALLDKSTWKENVLPVMGAWLGIEDKSLITNQSASEDFSGHLLKIIPSQPLLTQEEWTLIKEFYLNNAPDTLQNNNKNIFVNDLEKIFDIKEIKNKSPYSLPISTLLKSDSISKSIYVGKRDGTLYKYDYNFNRIDSSFFESGISDLLIKEDRIIPLLIGNIMPNDNPLGTINLDAKNTIIGLRRPVFIEEYDFNADGNLEYLIGNYGNNFGSLALYSKNNKNEYAEKRLLDLAGSIKAIIEDINNDNRPDILVLVSQKEESVYYLENQGNLNFKIKKLLQLPPVYGTTDLLYADIDNDNVKEIILACGDNADISPVLKPYHGIRIYKLKKEKYEEVKFLQLNGVTKISVIDFDDDEKLDIAAVCNFADFRMEPYHNFVLLKNENNLNFSYHYSSKTSVNKWLLMDVVDVNHDDKKDIVLASHLINMNIPPKVFEYWKSKNIELLLLLNK